MIVRIQDEKDLAPTIEAIELEFRGTRFRFRYDVDRKTIKFSMIRLKTPRPYCGNHPNECEVRPGQRPRKGAWLEGVDWVEFNDRLNDALDFIHADVKVFSSVCVLRKGKKRRIHYGSTCRSTGFRDFYEWEKTGSDEDYQDFCGRVAPASTYPDGTPGEYYRKGGETNEEDDSNTDAGGTLSYAQHG